MLGISLPGISISYLSLFLIDTYIYGKTNYKQIFCLCVVLNKITFSPIKGRQVRLLVLFSYFTFPSGNFTLHYLHRRSKQFSIRIEVVLSSSPTNKLVFQFPTFVPQYPIRVKLFINFSCSISIIAECVMKILAHLNTFSFNQSGLLK